MKKIIIAILFGVVINPCHLFAQDLSWEEYRQQRQQQFDQLQVEQDSALFANEAEYNAYVYQHEMELISVIAKIRDGFRSMRW